MSYIEEVDTGEDPTGLVRIHKPEDFEGMRKAGQVSARALDMLTAEVKPGVTTQYIDDLVYQFTMDNGALPATVFYKGYSKSCCTSVNHVVCHGIPGERVLKDGDILNIDVTSIVDGWHGDTSRMFWAGEPKIKARRLTDVTFECMWKGIEAVKPGATTGDIGAAIQAHAEAQRCSVVKDFCGHGLGRIFHEPPNILHYGRAGDGTVLREGMFFTIEPMINLGKWQVKLLNDGWTAVTKDKTLSAQFEHSLAVTADGYEVFTKSPAGLDCPPFAA